MRTLDPARHYISVGRRARVVIPECPHHVTQRGNDRQTVFFKDRDYEGYLRFLRHHCKHSGVSVLAYCLMPNHIHLVLVPATVQALAEAIGRTHHDYSHWTRAERAHSGHVWQGRFYSCPLPERHLWNAFRYVELNPWRARLAAHAWDWPWSSAPSHCGLGVDRGNVLMMEPWNQRWNGLTWRQVLTPAGDPSWFDRAIRLATATGQKLSPDLRPSAPASSGPR